MRSIIARLSLLSLVPVLLAGCGMTVQPRVNMDGADRPAVPPTDIRSPQRPTSVGGTPAAWPLVDRICRNRATPGGWVVIAYASSDPHACPRDADSEQRPNVKVIQRHTGARVGSTLVVCADQAVPRGWVRQTAPEMSDRCPGARVPLGAPTSQMIRRIR